MKTRQQNTTNQTDINITLSLESTVNDSIPAKLALAPLNVLLKATDHPELKPNEIINVTLSGTGQIQKSLGKNKKKETHLLFHLVQAESNNSHLCLVKQIDGNLVITKKNKEDQQAVLKGNVDMGSILKSKIEKRKIPYEQKKDEEKHIKTITTSFSSSAYGINTLFKINVEKPMKTTISEQDVEINQHKCK